jgi:hypothetical protein|nr:MAG TPA: hypothetical protein [Caudoviricetes sp.]
MTKFKVGDVVERTVTDVYCGLPSGEQGVVSKAVGNLVWIKGYGDWCHLAESLRLAEQDDPLPPAPESVRYNEGAGGFPFEVKSLRANAYYPNRIRLGVLCGDRAITHKYVVIDPDAALQLAHDLNRMANEIKRKEKQRLDDC